MLRFQVLKFWTNCERSRSKNFAKRFIKLLTFRQEIRIIRFLKFVFLKTFPKFPFSRSVKPILQVQITSKFVIDSSTRDQQVHRLVNPLLIVKVFEKLEILIFSVPFAASRWLRVTTFVSKRCTLPLSLSSLSLVREHDHKEALHASTSARIDSVTSSVITNEQRQRKSNEWLFYEFQGRR